MTGQLRQSDEIRGNALAASKSADPDVRWSGGPPDAKVVQLFRTSDTLDKYTLQLPKPVKTTLKDPLAELGFGLADKTLEDAGESCKVTLATGEDGRAFHCLFIDQDLIAPKDPEKGDARDEAKGEDFLFLAFMFDRKQSVKIFSDYQSTPSWFARLRQRMSQRTQVDVQWLFVDDALRQITEGTRPSSAAETILELYRLKPPEGAEGARADAGPVPSPPPAAPPQVPRAGVFVSYSHDDRDLMERIVAGFQQLEAENHEIFTDGEIKAGELWKQRLDAEVAKAQVMVLIITPNFFASDFIKDEELGPALEVAKEGGLKIFSIMASTTPGYRESPIAPYQFAYGPDHALDTLDAEDWGPALARTRDKLREALTT